VYYGVFLQVHYSFLKLEAMRKIYSFQRCIAFFSFLFMSTASWAYYFCVDGIYYERLSYGKNLYVTYKTTWEQVYSGDIYIPAKVEVSGVVWNVNYIGEKAFNGSSITSVTIENGVRSIEKEAFQSCQSLITIKLPESLMWAGKNAFAFCENLERVEFASMSHFCQMAYESQQASPMFITRCAYINGVKVTEAKIPDGVMDIGSFAFAYCPDITSVTIPESVITIKNNAFTLDTGLTSITLPGKLKTIEGYAFSGCENLTSVICLASTVPTVYDGVFNGVPLSSATLYVPLSALNAYKNADGWRDFGTIVGFDPSAVEELKSNNNLNANENAPIYDLMGRRLQQKPASGYYIQGGKKYFVK
jgi:hypothetical protein